MNVTTIFQHASVYRFSQAPFRSAKFAPVWKHNDLNKVRRVLDVGCGPGTNCSYFADKDYVGLDINPRYVEYARRRYQKRFELADLRTYKLPAGSCFDFILLNSFLHHIEDDTVARILSRLARALSKRGHIHIIDLVLPERLSIARVLARADRGDFPRPLTAWREIFTQQFQMVVFEPFGVKAFGITLWQLIYFKGKPKT